MPRGRFIPKCMFKSMIVEIISAKAATDAAVPIGSTPTTFAEMNQKTYVTTAGTRKLKDVYQMFLPMLIFDSHT